MILEQINQLIQNYRQRVEVIILNNKNQILLTIIPPFGSLTTPYHGFPGGGIENENPIEAVKRETLEEVGLDIDNIRKLNIKQFCLEINEETRKRKNISNKGTITNYYIATLSGNNLSLYNKDNDATNYVFVDYPQAINVIKKDIENHPDMQGKKILQYRLKVLHYLRNKL